MFSAIDVSCCRVFSISKFASFAKLRASKCYITSFGELFRSGSVHNSHLCLYSNFPEFCSCALACLQKSSACFKYKENCLGRLYLVHLFKFTRNYRVLKFLLNCLISSLRCTVDPSKINYTCSIVSLVFRRCKCCE